MGDLLQVGLSSQIVESWDLDHARGGEHSPAFEEPVIVLLQQHRTHHSLDRGIVGEDAHDACEGVDFLVDALEQVGASDPFLVFR